VTSVVPEKWLRLMSRADRRALGKAGLTAAECAARIEARTERALQGQIVALLRLRGIEALWHRTDRRSAATVGWPDITFAVRGRGGVRACAWEVKLNGRLTREQSDLARRLVDNGWDWRLIRSVEEASQALEEVTGQ